jgi:hypothetical protein
VILEPPIEPMLARLASELPAGDGWLFEPKWDGFRAIVFRDGDRLYLQSRDLRPGHSHGGRRAYVPCPETGQPKREATPGKQSCPGWLGLS